MFLFLAPARETVSLLLTSLETNTFTLLTYIHSKKEIQEKPQVKGWEVEHMSLQQLHTGEDNRKSLRRLRCLTAQRRLLKK